MVTSQRAVIGPRRVHTYPYQVSSFHLHGIDVYSLNCRKPTVRFQPDALQGEGKQDADNHPGYPASHGCIRLSHELARLLCGVTHLGITVVVTDRPEEPKIVRAEQLLRGSRAVRSRVPRLSGNRSGPIPGLSRWWSAPPTAAYGASERSVDRRRAHLIQGTIPCTSFSRMAAAPSASLAADCATRPVSGKERRARLCAVESGRSTSSAGRSRKYSRPGTTAVVTPNSLGSC